MAIKNIDDQILDLIAKRIETARQIGVEKRRLGLLVVDEKVSANVIKRYQGKCAQLGLESQLGEDLARILIGYSIKAQETR